MLNNYLFGTEKKSSELCKKEEIGNKLFITKELFENTQNLFYDFEGNSKIVIYLQ